MSAVPARSLTARMIDRENASAALIAASTGAGNPNWWPSSSLVSTMRSSRTMRQRHCVWMYSASSKTNRQTPPSKRSTSRKLRPNVHDKKCGDSYDCSVIPPILAGVRGGKPIRPLPDWGTASTPSPRHPLSSFPLRGSAVLCGSALIDVPDAARQAEPTRQSARRRFGRRRGRSSGCRRRRGGPRCCRRSLRASLRPGHRARGGSGSVRLGR